MKINISDQDWQEIIDILVKRAKGGNHDAATLLLEYYKASAPDNAVNMADVRDELRTFGKQVKTAIEHGRGKFNGADKPATEYANKPKR